MLQTLQVEHREHVTNRAYGDVLSAFMAQTGSVEEGYDAVAAQARTAEEFQRLFKAREGSSGFMRFLLLDHGAWLERFGRPAKAMLAIIGNPLIAITMIQHHLGVGLNVPVRLYIYEDTEGRTRVAYDLPSTLMSGLEDPSVTEAARKLDAKLVALAENITKVQAAA